MPDPTAHMSPEEAAAYAEALQKIEQCRKSGETRLDLSNLGLSALPPEIGQLTALTELYLWNNQLSTLPPEIGQLTALRELALHNNQLSTLPPEIGQLTALTGLFLFNNRLTTLPPEICQLTSLTELNLSSNQLSILPPEIGQLTALTKLSLIGNRLTTLPPEIGKLSRLSVLQCHGNRISTLPDEFCELNALAEFYYSQNRLGQMPLVVCQLKNLNRLELDENQLQELPSEISKLKTLETLVLFKNKLRTLPDEISKLPKLNALFLHGNDDLKLPSELLGATWQDWVRKDATPANAQDILAYYFSRQQADRPFNEIRLMLVGRGAAGKTSIADRLVKNTFNPRQEETPGIVQTDWMLRDCPGGDVVVHLWDLAGQVITHSMHQYFLSHRTVYLLVLTQREDSAAEDADYWLKLIKSYGTVDGETAPVLVALNKSDAAKVRVDRGRLQEMYPFIQGFVETDCESGRGIAELKQELCTLMDAPKVKPWVRQGYPQAWWAVKEAIRKVQADQPHITYEAWRNLCEDNGIPDHAEQDSVSRILHTLGVALNYADDDRLQDNTVLRPNWVTQHCYNLIRHAEKHSGELRRAELASVLGAEPNGEHDPRMHFYLMRLMERIEIAYPLGDNWPPERWLVPLALPDNQPAGVEVFGKVPALEAARLKYIYPNVPPGLVAQFIVRTHPLMEPKMQWANGTILTLNTARALVRAISKTEVEVTAIGADLEARRDLAGLCREEINGLNAQVKGMEVKENIEVVAYIDDGEPQGQEEIAWANVKSLQRDEAKGRETSPVETDEGSAEVITSQPLDEFGTIDFRMPNARIEFIATDLKKSPLVGRYVKRNLLPTLFISYSHTDERLRKRLELHLQVLKIQGLIHSTWHDRRIQPGMDWDLRIQDELGAADVVLFLTSTASLASGYINEDELRPALERHVKTEAVIVPIILERCDWVDTFAASDPLKVLPEPTRRVPQALPPDGKPIRSFNPQSEGWAMVAKGLKTLLTDVKTKLKKQD
jgi:internalin A